MVLAVLPRQILQRQAALVLQTLRLVRLRLTPLHDTTYSTVTLTGAGDIEVGAGINGSTKLDELGFTAGNFGGGEDRYLLEGYRSFNC